MDPASGWPPCPRSSLPSLKGCWMSSVHTWRNWAAPALSFCGAGWPKVQYRQNSELHFVSALLFSNRWIPSLGRDSISAIFPQCFRISAIFCNFGNFLQFSFFRNFYLPRIFLLEPEMEGEIPPPFVECLTRAPRRFFLICCKFPKNCQTLQGLTKIGKFLAFSRFPPISAGK